jgi:hypothetical protein
MKLFKFGTRQLVYGLRRLVFGVEAPSDQAGFGGGGVTIRKEPDPPRKVGPRARQTLEEQLDRVQAKPEPVAVVPEKPKAKPPVAVDTSATVDMLGVLGDIAARVQASIYAAAVIQAETDAALAVQAALMAEDEAELEMLLLAM